MNWQKKMEIFQNQIKKISYHFHKVNAIKGVTHSLPPTHPFHPLFNIDAVCVGN